MFSLFRFINLALQLFEPLNRLSSLVLTEQSHKWHKKLEFYFANSKDLNNHARKFYQRGVTRYFFSIIWLLKMGIFIVKKRLISLACVSSETHNFRPGGKGSPLYRLNRNVPHQRVCFLTVLVWNRVSISTILVWNRVWFVHSSLELGMFFRRISYFFIIWR